MAFVMRLYWAVFASAVPLLAQPVPNFREDVNLVRVPCIVTQANGAPAQGLRRDDFVVREDGVPQEVKYLWQERDLPLTVIFVVDITCSQGVFHKQYAQVVLQFLEHVLSPGDRAAIVSVFDQARLVTDLTDSAERLRVGAEDIFWGRARLLDDPILGHRCSGSNPTFLSLPALPCGGAALWNAVFFAAELGLQPQTGRKAMLLLTDGLDTGSDHNLKEAIAACQGADAMVYSIRYLERHLARANRTGEQWTQWVDRGKPDLDRIARETGGLVFEGRSADLSVVFDRIATDLRTQYVLGYTPSRAYCSRDCHKITVKVTHAGLKVRAQERHCAQ